MVNHYYIYALDRDFGPFFLKFCSYFPYNAKLCLPAISCSGKTETQESPMPSIHVDVAAAEWTSGDSFYGAGAVYQGEDIVRLKILSDRRNAGGGIALLAKFSPPPGKLIKIVATALSDEHVFNLEGGRATKSGGAARASGG